MTRKLQIYKCQVCGNMVEVLHEGEGQLVCCGQPMTLLEENTVDAAQEKHIPVVQAGEGVNVAVGSVAHPMEPGHYIEWIEILTDGGAYRQFLQPGLAPQATFEVKGTPSAARAYCNLHGLWRS